MIRPIRPTIGRVVWVWRKDAIYRDQPEAAFITYVWNDELVNVGGFNANGTPFGLTSVYLYQGNRPPQSGETFAEWMPYQKAQAEKHAAEEKASG